MKALVGAFNQEKALVGAFSVIVQPIVEPMDRFTALIRTLRVMHGHEGQSEGVCPLAVAPVLRGQVGVPVLAVVVDVHVVVVAGCWVGWVLVIAGK